jgi:hypothetical protein
MEHCVLLAWVWQILPLNPTRVRRNINMRIAGSVVRVLSMLGVLGIGLTTVAHAAGADRRAAREEREKRVMIAANARSADSRKEVASKVTAQSVSPSQRQYVHRLVSAAQHTLNYERGFLASENRLIKSQNRTIRQLNAAVNPNRTLALENTAMWLQASIDRNLTFINAIQPTIGSTLGALQAFVGVLPGLGATFNRLERMAVIDEQRAAVIAARPPFTIPPATAAL